ncbi:YcaO-like family protein [Amycolatopsis suaedae]|uniref:Bacteriocin biosynthesis protein SagD n=1 Tax=Amycolatopsis suaedae TaxID=2510978 RepID=A0A4Q7JCG2_9PSEU|nr:YcaO-like family protein [Amycolatopsis suaedae]RZQ64722.1 bacteriocin biosynthesis protein SagD [Amycolatopsis suaedae]
MHLVDERTGVIRRLVPQPVPGRLPAAFELIAAELSDTTRFSVWPSDSGGAGYALGDPDAAAGAAVGEAVERYCGNLVPPGLRHGAFDELDAAVDPESVALFSAEQYASEGFPFRPMTRDLPMEWADGVDLRTGRATLVPASLVWVSYVAAAVEAGLPPTNPIIQAGLAAGRGRAAAGRSALLELLERDTIALAWHGRAGLREVAPPPWLAAWGRGGHGTWRTRFVEFTGGFGVPVAGALVHDVETGYLAMGTACRPDGADALRKALAEACQLQLFVAGYDDPDGPYMRAAADPRSPLAPWRAGRDYAAAYRDDLRDVVDYGCHLQLYLDPAFQRRFLTELDDAVTGEVSWRDLPAGPPDLAGLVERVADVAGAPVVSVDVTTPDVVPSGLSVVRVLVPGLYSNSAAGLPFLGGVRQRDVLAGRPRRDLPLPH